MRNHRFTAFLGALCLLAGCEARFDPAMAPAAAEATQVAANTAPADDDVAAAPAEKPAAGDAAGAADAVSLKTVDYDGIVAAVAKHKGKIVVVDAWATWCPPCVKEFPGLVELHKKYGPEKVACMSLSFNDGSVTDDPDDGAQAALPFLKNQGATFDNLLVANEDVANECYKKLGFASIPAVLVYNQEGNLEKLVMHSEKKDAKPTYEQVNELVDQLLAAGQE